MRDAILFDFVSPLKTQKCILDLKTNAGSYEFINHATDIKKHSSQHLSR